MSIDDWLNLKSVAFKNGEWIEKVHVGRKLTFDEIANRVGMQIVMDYSTISREWFKVVLVKKIIEFDGSRRLVFKDDTRNRGYVNETYFSDDYCGYKSKAYELV